MKNLKILILLFVSIIVNNISAQDYQALTGYLFSDSCCLALKVIDNISDTNWTIDIIDEADGTVVQTLTYLDFTISGVTHDAAVCNLPSGTYTTSFSPNTVPSGSTEYPIETTLPLCLIEDCAGVLPDMDLQVSCFDLTAIDLSTNTSGGNFTHIEWYVDGTLIGTDLPGGILNQTLSLGIHTICLKMFVFDDGICCHQEICKVIKIDPCLDLEAEFSFITSACSIEFSDESNFECGVLDQTNWFLDGVLFQNQTNQFIHEFDDTLDHIVCIETTILLPDGSFCSENYCETVSVSANCKDIESKMVLSSPMPCPTGNGDCCITALHLSNTTPTNVDWIWGDGSSSTGVNSTHTYDSDGTYQITMIATYSPTCDTTLCCVQTRTELVNITGCGSNKSFNSENELITKPVSNKEKLNIYPNTLIIGEDLNIKLSENSKMIKEVKIYDLNGKLILERNYSNENSTKVIIKLKEIKISGIYLVNIIDGLMNRFESKIIVK